MGKFSFWAPVFVFGRRFLRRFQAYLCSIAVLMYDRAKPVMSGFTGQTDIARSTTKGLGRGGVGSFFGHAFMVWRLRPYTGLSSGLLLLLLLLMCYSSGNMETTQRLGIGNVTDHRLCMANGEWLRI